MRGFRVEAIDCGLPSTVEIDDRVATSVPPPGSVTLSLFIVNTCQRLARTGFRMSPAPGNFPTAFKAHILAGIHRSPGRPRSSQHGTFTGPAPAGLPGPGYGADGLGDHVLWLQFAKLSLEGSWFQGRN